MWKQIVSLNKQIGKKTDRQKIFIAKNVVHFTTINTN